jgi:hypothetical protein
MFSLNFSPSVEKFNARRVIKDGVKARSFGISRSRHFLGVQNFFIDFGTSVAYNPCKPLGANPVRENKNGQESFEEGEEDGTDQAID